MDQKQPAFGSSWGFPTATTTSQQQPAQQTPAFSFGSTGGFGSTQPSAAAPAASGFGGFGAFPAATSAGGFFTNAAANTTGNFGGAVSAAASSLTAQPATSTFSFGSAFGTPAATQAPAFGSSGFSLFGNTAATASNTGTTTTAPVAGSGFGSFSGFGGAGNTTATNAGSLPGFGSAAAQPTVAAPTSAPTFSFGQAVGTAPASNVFGGGAQPSTAPAANTSFPAFGSTSTPQTTASTAFGGPSSNFTGFNFGQPAATSTTTTFGNAPTASTAPLSFNFGGNQSTTAAAPAVSTATVPSFGFNTGQTSTSNNVLTTPSIFSGITNSTTANSAAVSTAPATAPVGGGGFSFGGNTGTSSFNFAATQPTTTAQTSFGFQSQQSQPLQPPSAAVVTEPQKPPTFGTPSTNAAPSLFGSFLQQPSATTAPPPATAPGTAPVTSAVGGFSFAPGTSATSTAAPGSASISQPLTAMPATPSVTMQTPMQTPSITATATSSGTSAVPSFSFGSSSVAAPLSAAVQQPSSAAVSSQPTSASAAVGGFSFGLPKPASATPVPQTAAATPAPSTSSAFGSGFSFQLPVTSTSATTQPPGSAAVIPASAQPTMPLTAAGTATASVTMPTAAPQQSRPTFQFAGAPLVSSAPLLTSAAPVAPATFTLPTPKPLLLSTMPVPLSTMQSFATPASTVTSGFVLPAASVSQLILPTAAAPVKPDEVKVPVSDATKLQQQPVSAQAAAPVVSLPTITMPTASVGGAVSSTLVSPSRAARVSFQLPHSGLVVSPGKNRSLASGLGTSGTAALVLDEQDRDRMLKLLRSWTWRDLSEFCDIQARELDSVHTETFHAGHIWLLSLQVLREEMQDKLSVLIEASKSDYDQAHRLERELDYIDAELNELEKLVDNGEAIVRERTKQFEEKQQMASTPRYAANPYYANNYYGNADMPNSSPIPQLADYLHELYATVYDACASTYEFTQRFEAVRNAFTATLFPSSFSSNERHWILEAPHEAQHSSTFSQLIMSSIAYAELFRFDRLHHMLRCLEQIQLEYEHLYKSLSERIQPELAVRIAANIERRLRVVEARFRVAEKMGADELNLIGGLNIRSDNDAAIGRFMLPAAGSGGGLDLLPVATTMLSSPYQRK